ncbi:helix-turn-helix domain-containing protein [Streptomyces syringium]|uniref:helix-turn-helix domain-containing protein n=1 Tax=Streptomyces syringium TaxID=76729 RepID=UPI003AAEC9DF
MDSRDIGRRIAYWRTVRRLTQADFGALMGQSRRWVQNLEGGLRQRDPRLSVLEDAARVLRIPLERLLSDAPPGTAADCTDAAELAAIRAALHRHDVITGTCDADCTGAPPLPALRRSVVHARTAFQAGAFASLGRLVPDLLVTATRAAAHHEGEQRLEAWRLLCWVLEVTEAAAIKAGDTDLAVTSAHRAVAAAERTGDPVTMASAARHLADAMTHHGQPRVGADFAVAAAARLSADLQQRGADGLSVLGMLYLKAAMATAAVAEQEEARAAAAAAAVPALLDQADEHATQLGADDNRLWTAFGPTNVCLYRVAAHVQLSEGGDAVDAALAIPDPARQGLPRERRAHHLTDLAHAYTQAGQRQDAVTALLDAEDEAPEEVRCRPRTHRLVEDLRLLGVGSSEGILQELAGRCGLPR